MECRVGIVKSIQDGKLEVQITRNSACSSCHAKGACTSQDTKEQIITITDFPIGLKEGDSVSILADSSLSWRAILFAFIIPLTLILITALILNDHGISEDLMVVILLGALVLYGGVLWLLRRYFSRVFSFRAIPIDGQGF